ncbi:galactose/methyl galactoside import ATP-binding protein MglA [Striga asiatica]|uniref:Galactose/methyl galactoside import ATP-binding protein MglA n=1 Tax=Striga asiatica TaxID=4170 RepID=A0A5A7QDR1_STRAF|nr:galactose/methyl galactoside import ATP-binding protein MglA [Striga asiatica]
MCWDPIDEFSSTMLTNPQLIEYSLGSLARTMVGLVQEAEEAKRTKLAFDGMKDEVIGYQQKVEALKKERDALLARWLLTSPPLEAPKLSPPAANQNQNRAKSGLILDKTGLEPLPQRPPLVKEISDPPSMQERREVEEKDKGFRVQRRAIGR